MAKLKYNYKFNNVVERSSDSEMSAIVLRESIHRVMAQSSRDDEKYLQTISLADRTVISQTADSNNDNKYKEVLNIIGAYLERINKKSIGGIDIKDSISGCLSFKEIDESLATGISINSDGRPESNKLYNIKFNLKKFIGAIVELGLTIGAAISGELCSAIFTGISAVISLMDATTIELDDNCGKILRIIYLESDQDGIKRDDLVRQALEEGDMAEQEIDDAIDKLIKYRCIKVNKQDFLVLCESIYITDFKNMANA